ncbi:hypothetical protein QYE76_009620 [Lolium multiflorum]|uniref:Reverse transcriptase Ty1/copia-type domain-containing protein n=1 Tax=Lolium multiflorum TaxID=4521 RepID=A0AAD8TVK7_LOLMU|nr:hypothetical protein QYE76_009620 [Lolium multiflorum]
MCHICDYLYPVHCAAARFLIPSVGVHRLPDSRPPNPSREPVRVRGNQVFRSAPARLRQHDVASDDEFLHTDNFFPDLSDFFDNLNMGDNDAAAKQINSSSIAAATRPPSFDEEQGKFEKVDAMFKAALFSILGDNIVDPYMAFDHGKDAWDALEAKFGVSDAGTELYVMEQYYDYRMTDERSVVEQAHEIQSLAKELEQFKCTLPDKFVAERHDRRGNSGKSANVVIGVDTEMKDVGYGCKDLLRADGKRLTCFVRGVEHFDNPVEDDNEAPKRSKRQRTAKSFGHDFIVYLVDDTPTSISEAYASRDADYWKEAVRSEMDSILANGTWEVTDRPYGCKPVGCKWVFKKKLRPDGTIEKYKARLVAKGYTQKEERSGATIGSTTSSSDDEFLHTDNFFPDLSDFFDNLNMGDNDAAAKPQFEHFASFRGFAAPGGRSGHVVLLWPGFLHTVQNLVRFEVASYGGLSRLFVSLPLLLFFDGASKAASRLMEAPPAFCMPSSSIDFCAGPASTRGFFAFILCSSPKPSPSTATCFNLGTKTFIDSIAVV